MSNLSMDFLRWFILTHKMCFEHYCMLFFFHFNLKVLQMCVCVRVKHVFIVRAH